MNQEVQNSATSGDESPKSNQNTAAKERKSRKERKGGKVQIQIDTNQEELKACITPSPKDIQLTSEASPNKIEMVDQIDDVMTKMANAANIAAMDNREQELEKTGDKTSTKDIVNVLVIVTGGTLSMV